MNASARGRNHGGRSVHFLNACDITCLNHIPYPHHNLSGPSQRPLFRLSVAGRLNAKPSKNTAPHVLRTCGAIIGGPGGRSLPGRRRRFCLCLSPGRRRRFRFSFGKGRKGGGRLCSVRGGEGPRGLEKLGSRSLGIGLRGGHADAPGAHAQGFLASIVLVKGAGRIEAQLA